MRVQGHWGHQRVNILIDSGSAHNFVHPSLAKGMRKVEEKGTTLKVYAALGAVMHNKGKLLEAHLQIQHYHCKLKFFCFTSYGM